MVNAWSLLYDEYYGTMNETFPVNNEEPDDNIVISTGSSYSTTNDVYTDTLNITIPDDMPSEFTALSDNDDAIAHLIDKPVS